ncbi:hypothetical protein VNO77_34287 [Canavalia gladiata]|uniref:Uncharacterized protein n=1 Tax=Canavalia gladiata TaxID=3824 RepID=A0AAN9KGA4_CANGL
MLAVFMKKYQRCCARPLFHHVHFSSIEDECTIKNLCRGCPVNALSRISHTYMANSSRGQENDGHHILEPDSIYDLRKFLSLHCATIFGISAPQRLDISVSELKGSWRPSSHVPLLVLFLIIFAYSILEKPYK